MIIKSPLSAGRLRLLLSTLVGLCTFCLHWRTARAEWFWTDETYTAWGNLFHRTTLDYLSGNSDEGNSAPLFYLIERCVFHLIPFASKLELNSILLLRTPSLLATGLWMGVVTYLLLNRLTWLRVVFAGLLVLALQFTTTLASYSWQARPYAILALLSFCYATEVFSSYVQRKVTRRLLLFASLLILITPFALFEVSIFCGLLALSLYRSGVKVPALFRQFIYLAPPLAYSVFLVTKTQQLAFFWPADLYKILLLVTAHAKYWIALLGGFFLLSDKRKSLKIFAASYVLFLGFLLGIILGSLYLHRGIPGFEIPNRYFLFLMPHSLAIVVFFARSTFDSFSRRSQLLIVGATLLFLVQLIHQGKVSYAARPTIYPVEVGQTLASFSLKTDECYCLLNRPQKEAPSYFSSMLFLFDQNKPLGCQKYVGVQALDNWINLYRELKPTQKTFSKAVGLGIECADPISR